MPHVIVKLWPGKSEKQKQKLADEITRSVMSALDYGEESVSVAFEEVSAEDWAAKVYRTDIVGNEQRLYKRPGYTMKCKG
jgi:4-oxalocrotonate tautomerase